MKKQKTKWVKLTAFCHVAECKPCDCDFNGENPALICDLEKPSKKCTPNKGITFHRKLNEMYVKGEFAQGETNK